MTQRPSFLFSPAPDAPTHLRWLGAAEREHLAGLRLAKRRAEWLQGRWTAKQALLLEPAAEIEVGDLASLEILPTPTGGPRVFLHGQAMPIALSLSHRAGAALCVVAAEGSVGCDLEWVEPRSAAFVEDYFNPSERALMMDQDADTMALIANAMWSAKESVLKLLGVGLSVDTRSLTLTSFPGPPSGEWRPISLHHLPDSKDFSGWWLRRDNWLLTVVTRPACRQPLERHQPEGRGGRVPAS